MRKEFPLLPLIFSAYWLAAIIVVVMLLALPSRVAASTTLEPYSLFGSPDGYSDNAARTRDVAPTLQEVLEHDRLIDARGITACDRYFGWGGVERINTSEQMYLCGKYQFFYEHWGTVGMPKPLLEFNEKWFPKFFGDEFEHIGYYPNPNRKRVITDVREVEAGQCLIYEEACSGSGKNRSCTKQCARVATENTYKEDYYMVDDDQLPVGFQIGPKISFGFESAGFACAGCHFTRLPDGRFAVGMPMQNLNYGQLIAGFATPMQATMAALMQPLGELTYNPGLLLLSESNEGLKLLLGMLDLMKMHPAMMFNDPATRFGMKKDMLEAMSRDFKRGTCYYKPDGEFIRCDHNHAERGPQEQRDKAERMYKQLVSQFGNVERRDWIMAMEEVYGDVYCVPSPKTPADYGGSPDASWGQYQPSWNFRQMFASMRDNCAGNRWNIEYYKAFADMVSTMMKADFEALVFPNVSEQDMFINAGFNVIDFLEAPMSDDQVWTLSKIVDVVGISSQATLAAHPDMRSAGGRTTQLLGLAAPALDLTQFVSGFLMLSGSVDPRFMQCETPGIIGNWGATPDATCTVKTEFLHPLVAYIESLRAPWAAPAASKGVAEGREVFGEHCAGCHSGPKGETPGVFIFGERAGLESLPLCAPGQRTVEWTSDMPANPIYNHCRPLYSEVSPDAPRIEDIVRYLGIIDTDANYSRAAQPNVVTGFAGVNPELASLGKISQGVKGHRLTGIRYKSELLHHGQLKSLDELLCMPDTVRETAEQRAETRCMVYDLSSKNGLARYKQGDGQCLQQWQPFKGHEFGCNLSVGQRRDLIEYLKTL